MIKRLVAGVVILGVFLLAACSGGGQNEPAPTLDPNAPTLTITAKNWEFDQAEYRVKAGEPINVVLKNEEGIHGIEIRGQGIKLDNKKTSTVWTPSKPGTYEIVCNIPCGLGHSSMKSVIIVE